MNSFSFRFNQYLLTAVILGPFLAWLTIKYLDMDFLRIAQLLSFFGVFLIVFLNPKENHLKFPKYLLFYLLFIFYDFFSTIYLLDRNFEFSWLFANRMIGAFNLMFIIENIKISDKHFKRLLSISKVTLIIALAVIMVQQVVDPEFFVHYKDEHDRRVTTLNDYENRLVSIYSWFGTLSVGFGFVPVFIIVVEQFYKKNRNLLSWLALGIIFAILSKARWIMLNTMLVFAVLLLNKKFSIKEMLKYAFILPLLMLFVYFSMIFSGINADSIIKNRILENDRRGFENTSANTRVLAVKAFNKFYWDNPILGRGNVKYGMGGEEDHDYKLRTFLAGRSSQIHVGYLSLFYTYGLIGGLLFMSFLVLVIKKLYLNSQIHGNYGPFFGVLGFAIANLTLVTYSFYEVGIIFALIADKYFTEKRLSQNGLAYN